MGNSGLFTFFKNLELESLEESGSEPYLMTLRFSVKKDRRKISARLPYLPVCPHMNLYFSLMNSATSFAVMPSIGFAMS